MKLKPEKNSGLNGIRTHDLYDTGAVLYQVSYQVNCELVIYPYMMKNTSECTKDHIFELGRKISRYD